MHSNQSNGNSPQATNGPLRRLESWVCALQRMVDVLIIIGAQALAHTLYPEPWTDQTTTVTVIALLVFGFASEMEGLYRPWRTGSILQESKDAMIAWLAVPVALFAFWFFTKTASHYSRIASFAWFAFTPLFLCAVRIGARIIMRILRMRGRDLRRVGILGCTKDAERLTEAFETRPWLGLKLVGVYDDRGAERRHIINHPNWSVIGRSDDLVRDCHEGKIDLVYVALPLRAEARTAEILAALSDTTVTVYLVADLLYCSLLRAQWGQIGGVPVVSLHDSPFQGLVGWIKRIEDLVLGSFIVLLTAIPMLCIAIAIKIKSPGPIFFKQWRYGLSGKKIRILKFRTMTVCEDGADVVQVVKDDVRVTKLGKFLRRTSLDEFPQFFQVLTGELSLVGPRPHAVAHNEKYRAIIHGYMLRHMVKPGITGWAQVNGWRGETAELVKMEERVRHDMEYISKWNLLLDLKIIFLTVFGAKKSLHAC
ncbi:MAG TPA: undecaprenyl-phosphate glucose phosphotransferase [Polyangia bacterium]